MHCAMIQNGKCKSNNLKPCPFGADSDKCDQLYIDVRCSREAWEIEVSRLNAQGQMTEIVELDGNNDGCEVCRWCGEPTKELVLFASITRVCSICNK